MSNSPQDPQPMTGRSQRAIKAIVLGGAGDMGSRTVMDLAAHPDVDRVVIADYNEKAACALAAKLKTKKITVVSVDANDHRGLVSVMSGFDVAAGAIGPFYKYERMCAEAAIDAGCPYVSLCDDYDAAQAVLQLNDKAKAAGVTVLTGLGWTPGMSNILAKRAASELDQVLEINIAWGGSASDSDGFAVILHTLHIFTGYVPSFSDGKHIQVAAGSGKERVRFPQPVGEVNVFHLGHPEPVTLPRAFPGIKAVTLKGGLSEDFLNSLASLLGTLRLTNTAQKRQNLGKLLKPILPTLGKIGKPANPCSAIRVDAIGLKNGKRSKVTYGAADHMNNLTGVPMAIGAVLLGSHQITASGVVAPEDCIDPSLFIRELAKRNIKVYRGDNFESVVLQ